MSCENTLYPCQIFCWPPSVEAAENLKGLYKGNWERIGQGFIKIQMLGKGLERVGVAFLNLSSPVLLSLLVLFPGPFQS